MFLHLPQRNSQKQREQVCSEGLGLGGLGRESERLTRKRYCLAHVGVDKKGQSGRLSGLYGLEPHVPHVWKTLLSHLVVCFSLLESLLFGSSHEFVMLLLQVLKQTEVPGGFTVRQT